MYGARDSASDTSGAFRVPQLTVREHPRHLEGAAPPRPGAAWRNSWPTDITHLADRKAYNLSGGGGAWKITGPGHRTQVLLLDRRS
jgi:hypothetical protein